MWEPVKSDIAWMDKLFCMLKEGGKWIAPITGQVFEKKGKSLILVNEGIPDSSLIFERSKIIGSKLGISVIKKSEEEHE